MTEPESPQPPEPAAPAAPPAAPSPAATAPPPAPSPAAVAASAAGAAATMLWSRLSAGEKIAVIGAALMLVLGDWIVGGLLNGPGNWVSTTIASAELIFFVVVRHSGRAMAWPIPYATILAGLAVAIAAPAASDLFNFLRQLTEPGRITGIGVVGELTELVGAALVAWGSFVTWRAGAEN